MISHIKTEKVSPGRYTATYDNGVDLGDILMMECGYYYWWPSKRDGCLDEGFLLDMHNTLKAINKPWDDQVQNDPSIGHGEYNMEQGECI